ncbi:MAG: hypothetical protein ACR2PZ_22315 [Pseudomonadales bacterium]
MRRQISLPFRLVRWGAHRWLASYLKQQKLRCRSAQPKHVLFLVTDHFEPPKQFGIDKSVDVVRHWCQQYKAACAGQTDSFGTCPRYSWFYRYDNPIDKNLQLLSEMVYAGYGEVEFHLHHGNDTSESFRTTINSGLSWFNRYGAMLGATPHPQPQFAYIAGNWALDNARFDASFSGVNDEIGILGEAGCYADFTFPALGERSQPTRVNQTLWVKDDGNAAAFQRSSCLLDGAAANEADLAMIQGPLYVDWKQGDIEYGALEAYSGYHTDRIQRWLSAGVCADQHGEVQIIKLHTHGVQSEKALFENGLSQLFADLKSNVEAAGGKLHYVTARECFNIVQGLRDQPGRNPAELRGFAVPEPANSKILADAPYRLSTFSEQKICVVFDSRPPPEATMSIKGTGVEKMPIEGLAELELLNPGQPAERIVSRPSQLAG